MLWRSQLFYHASTASSRPLVASSACLLGEAVRYNGAHKLQPGIERWLAPHLQLQAICPEVSIGLPIPRPPMKLVERGQQVRAVEVQDDSVDVTDALRRYAQEQLHQIGAFWPLCGWIFKARSPSCGHGSSPINPGTEAEKPGSGIFAGSIAEEAPWLPLYEEEDLLTERDCAEMLLLTYLASDILWQSGEDEPGAMKEHYQCLLGLPEREFSGRDRHNLWQSVKTALAGANNEKRRELLKQYRAA